MSRFALGIEYDGTAYHGWQWQEDIPTIQHSLEQALSLVADHPVRVVCSGRTDASVHATQQVVHFDSDSQRDLKAWILGTNANLPPDIKVRWAKPVADTFHARFCATSRAYQFVIYNHPIASSLMRHRVLHISHPLDHESMHSAAQYLLGEHDFSSFRASQCQAKHPIRAIISLAVNRDGDLIKIDIRANAFLHHMVRNIAGVLIKIGKGEAKPIWAKEVLEARDRTLAGVTAEGQGLYLVDVEYPKEFELDRTEMSRLMKNPAPNP